MKVKSNQIQSNPGLSRKQEQALEALLSQPNIAEAARIADCSQRTLYRYLSDPGFDAAYRAARRAAIAQSAARLQQATGAASTTILKIMVDSTHPPQVRCRAAEMVIKIAYKSIEVEDRDDRISALEKAQEAYEAALRAKIEAEKKLDE